MSQPSGVGLPPLLAIVGPTGVGKSAVAVEVALKAQAEVVSADSMQVYRGLDIGTGKIRPEERRGVPHHLLDVVDPADSFTVAQFKELADQALQGIAARGRLPLLVGGTGLYYRAVTTEYLFPGAGASLQLRTKLAEEAAALGSETLHQRLIEVDPAAAGRIHPNDLRRVIRALEVYAVTGKRISELQAASPAVPRFDLLVVGLTCEREELYRRIEHRVDQMLGAGLLDEVRGLVAAGLAGWLTSVQALGYKEFLPYLRGTADLKDCVAVLKQQTRRYAKRQLTWFRHEPGVVWLTLDRPNEPSECVERILSLVKGRWPQLANS